MSSGGWRGATYLGRPGSARTYEEARERVRALGIKSWREYQSVAWKHNLPTEPQKLWPEEWEEGGRYTGYLGTVVGQVEREGLMSAMEIREALGIGHKTWKVLSSDLKPDAGVSHKLYYEPGRVRTHVAARLDRIKHTDSREAVRQALSSL